MGKKLGENSKAIEARERKTIAKKAVAEKAAKDADDRLWADDDKNLAKKKQRKEEEERKKAEQLRKKQEAKLLLEEEMKSIKVGGKESIQKITRAQIQQEVETRNKNIEIINKTIRPEVNNVVVVPTDDDLVENLNRVVLESNVAATVDEAIAVLRSVAICI